MESIGLINGLPFDKQRRFVASRPRPRSHSLARLHKILFVVFLASILLSVGWHVVLSQKANAQEASTLGPPLPSYILYGYTYDSASNPIGSANVTIVNMNTADAGETVSDVNGYYQFNLANLPNGYSLDDAISITGNTTEYIGYNSTAVTGSGGKWLNVTLNVFVAEFSSLVVPIGAMMLIVSLAPAIRRRISKKQDCRP